MAIAAVIASMAMVYGSPASAATPQTVTRPYSTPLGEVMLGSSNSNDQGLYPPPSYWLPPTAKCGDATTGGPEACFLVKAGMVIDSITVLDDHMNQVAAQVRFRNDANAETQLSTVSKFCGSAKAITMPQGYAQMVVSIGAMKGDAGGPTGPCAGPAPGTTGKIVVTGAALQGNAGQAPAGQAAAAAPAVRPPVAPRVAARGEVPDRPAAPARLLRRGRARAL
ncbi:MAG: hypothetical protein ACYDGR_04990 [Candidatus Dormibacteria bacterium]